MGNVTQINVEGRNYNLVAGQAAKGACTTSVAAYEKIVVLPDSTDIVVGMLVAVTFVNGNTAGFSGKKTIYSSDGTNFYWDSNLTDPVVLPPEGCYIIENTSGQEYEYQAFPVLSVNGEVLPLCNSKGHPTGGPLWNAGDVVTFLYLEDRFIAILAEEGTDIKVYPTLADAEADLNNLSEGDIVGTEQGGDGAVDAVIAGDYRLVTSNAVAEKISTLGNNFTFTQVSGLTYENFQSFKFGNMCAITGAINGSNISSGASLLTLPSGCRPSKTIYVNGVCESSNAKYPCVFQVSASGGISFWHYGSNVTGVFMSIIFRC